LARESEAKLEAWYGLPEQVTFCNRCLMSNQRPASSIEFRHSTTHRHTTLHIDEDGICDACRFADQKETIDWPERETELLKLLDNHRRDDGYYDCIVPGSGGKDSCYAAHVLKYKYGMHPLTVTWAPILYTDIGWSNFQSWIDVGGFDNVTSKPNGKVSGLLTRLAIENLLHPFQPFILGQKNVAPRAAMNYGVPLIFYGENEAEYGNPIADNDSSLRDKSYYASDSLDSVRLSGLSVSQLMEEHDLSLSDLHPYLPIDQQSLQKSHIEVRYLGYYMKWTPQEAYYYAVEHTGFEANPVRTEGTYSKYNSLDDKADGLHFYTSYIKFGLGRTSYEASQEIRNRHLTREEGVALARRFDGEFPQEHFQEVMDFIGMDPQLFIDLCDSHRSPHLWQQEAGEWKLRHQP
jgi:N-acetyl sugar amidotransferase